MSEGETSGQRDWAVDIEEEHPLEEEQLWEKHSIYKVPTGLKHINDKAYMPQVVSFGPYHHGESDLMPMEGHKRRSRLRFLKRTGQTIGDYVNAMEKVVQQLMDSYEQLDEHWKDTKRFVQLMILDGCFMLEVMRVYNSEHSMGYAPKDPIFSSHGKIYVMPHIKRDMLMIENQIPLLVLQKLVAIEKGSPQNEYINSLVEKFFFLTSPALGPFLHVLDMVRKSAIQGGPPQVKSPPKQSTAEIIRSAMELHESYLREAQHSLSDITFEGGVLRLPSITIADITEYRFLNQMAFERLHVGAGNEVTSYVFFMDNIIDSAKDVSFLHSKGLIQNAIGSDKAVANTFNGLSKETALDPDSSLKDVHEKVNKYCKKKWNVWRAISFIHTSGAHGLYSPF